MKKSKKLKKDDVVEVSQVVFKNSRQNRKPTTRAEIIKKVIDDECIDDNDIDSESEYLNLDTKNDDERMESLDSLSESAFVGDDESIQIFRDVMSMSDDDRNIDTDGKLAPVRLSPPPSPSWIDNSENIKFKVGEFVRYKGFPNSSVYKVVGYGKKEDTYNLKGSKTRDSYIEDGKNLVKVKDKKVDWVDYWSLHPVIPAPKPWLKKKN